MEKKVWLEEPSWDCKWYWGFGYIERYTNNQHPEKARNITSHSHWNYEIVKHGIHHINENINAFQSTTLTDSESWELADLMQSFYTLQKTAAIFHQGNSHLSSCKEINLIDKELENNINKNILPKIFKRIDDILSPIKKEK